jgi:hypothetical protein
MKTELKSADRDVLQLECDSRAHRDANARKAWFSCGSQWANLQMALACGWTEREGAWSCPYCAACATSYAPLSSYAWEQLPRRTVQKAPRSRASFP